MKINVKLFAVARERAGANAIDVELSPPATVRSGRLQSFTADYAAPEFLWLRDGSNYCGRIFQGCLR